MSKKIISFIFFTSVGAATAWFYAKKKYEKIAQEEIDSVKETLLKDKTTDLSECGPDENVDESTNDALKLHLTEKPSFMEYSNMIDNKKYASEEKNERGVSTGIRVISPDEFGEMDEYEQISLTYYADGVLTDDNDAVIDDVDSTVGKDALDHFGEYEDDSVYVRNDVLKCDFEILLDQRDYSEVEKEKPLSERRHE